MRCTVMALGLMCLAVTLVGCRAKQPGEAGEIIGFAEAGGLHHQYGRRAG